MNHGRRVDLGYTLKTSLRALKKHYCTKDGKISLISFSEHLNLYWSDTFGASEQANKIERSLELRKHSALPLEEDVQKLNCYLKSQLEELIEILININ
jgi:hypothetical protein